jgi:putative membrane fusion protein
MDTDNKRKALQMGGLLGIVFLLIYLPSLFHWIYGGSISTEIVRSGIIEDTVNCDVSIVRDETVLDSPFEGSCILTAGEGDKVPMGARVATVLRDDSMQLYEELRKKDVEILKVQKQKSENQDFFSEDLVKIEEDISQKLLMVIEEGNRNSFSGTRQLREDIDVLVRKKASIFGSKSKSDSFIKSLQAEKHQLELKIRQGTREIVSGFSGIVSYSIDGYEKVLYPAAIPKLKPDTLADIKNKASHPGLNHVKVGLNKPFMKIIRDIDCYLVFVLDEKSAAAYKVDDIIRIRINDINKVIDGTVDYKSEKLDGKYVVSVKIDKGISDTVSLRKINIDLIKRSYSGLKVPLSSLRNIDTTNMNAELVLAKGSYASVRKVHIAGQNADSAIIEKIQPDKDKGGNESTGSQSKQTAAVDKADAEKENLDKEQYEINLYDIFIVNPGKIQEGQLINP